MAPPSRGWAVTDEASQPRAKRAEGEEGGGQALNAPVANARCDWTSSRDDRRMGLEMSEFMARREEEKRKGERVAAAGR